MKVPWRRTPPPVRPSRDPSKRPAAVFTIVQNEPLFLPVWSGYYRRHFEARDVFVLDHDSDDPATLAAASELNRVPVHRLESFDHDWLRDTVQRFQAFLLQSYDAVLFAEVDEIVAPAPERHPGGLRAFLERFVAGDAPLARCTGYDVVHDARGGEPALDWSAPILSQRRLCRSSESYSKPLLARRPLDWKIGFHELASAPPPQPDPELLLIHLHRVDYDSCRRRTLETAARRWSAADIEKDRAAQNRITDAREFEEWFYSPNFDDEPHELEAIPAGWKEIV